MFSNLKEEKAIWTDEVLVGFHYLKNIMLSYQRTKHQGKKIKNEFYEVPEDAQS